MLVSAPPRRDQVVDIRQVLGVRDAAGFAMRTFDLQARRRPVDAELAAHGTPLVLVEGALLRTVGLHQRTGAELLGAGDAVVVGPEAGDMRVAHRVLTSCRFGVLDQGRLAHLAQSPEVLFSLLDAAERRTATIAAQIVISQFNSLDDRLRVLLGELAERWGVMRPDGIVLPGFLSHTVLAALTGARRPSLTTAVVRVTEAGHLRRLDDRRWLVDPAFVGL